MTVREFNEAARAGGPKAFGLLETTMSGDSWGWGCVCGVRMPPKPIRRSEAEAKRQLAQHLALCHD